MIMKTKHVKNTEQMVRRGNWKNYQGGGGGVKLPGWGKRGKLPGGQKNAQGAISSFTPGTK